MAFARSARLALAGLLAPPALLGLASAAGLSPARRGRAGLLARRARRLRRRRVARRAAARGRAATRRARSRARFLAAVPAGSHPPSVELNGLTGHESMLRRRGRHARGVRPRVRPRRMC
ncbi:MAG: hypothetical protein M0C28_16185 [Candidatus Moduliflexus flocculans]|nr:hypothetical protein [Candidatus Moduliflexus flocculans]